MTECHFHTPNIPRLPENGTETESINSLMKFLPSGIDLLIVASPSMLMFPQWISEESNTQQSTSLSVFIITNKNRYFYCKSKLYQVRQREAKHCTNVAEVPYNPNQKSEKWLSICKLILASPHYPLPKEGWEVPQRESILLCRSKGKKVKPSIPSSSKGFFTGQRVEKQQVNFQINFRTFWGGEVTEMGWETCGRDTWIRRRDE